MRTKDKSVDPAAGEPQLLSVLGLGARRRRRPRSGIGWLPLADVMVIAVFAWLWRSDWLFVPGTKLVLPETGQVAYHRADAVLTVQGDLYFFDNKVMRRTELPAAFRDYLERMNRWSGGERSLLLRIAAGGDVGGLLGIVDEASAAGFEQVVIAQVPADDSRGQTRGF